MAQPVNDGNGLVKLLLSSYIGVRFQNFSTQACPAVVQSPVLVSLETACRQASTLLQQPRTLSLFGRPYRIVDYLLLAGLV